MTSPCSQWEFLDPKMEVLHHIMAYFPGISPYIGLKNRPKIYGIGTSFINRFLLHGHWYSLPIRVNPWKNPRKNHHFGSIPWKPHFPWWIPQTSVRPRRPDPWRSPGLGILFLVPVMIRSHFQMCLKYQVCLSLSGFFWFEMVIIPDFGGYKCYNQLMTGILGHNCMVWYGEQMWDLPWDPRMEAIRGGLETLSSWVPPVRWGPSHVCFLFIYLFKYIYIHIHINPLN